jgi:hypothetical protein
MKVPDLNASILTLQTHELRPLARFFEGNLIRADNLRWMHLHLIYPGVLESLRIKVMTRIIESRIIPVVIGPNKQFTSEFLKEVHRRMMETSEEPIDEYLA